MVTHVCNPVTKPLRSRQRGGPCGRHRLVCVDLLHQFREHRYALFQSARMIGIAREINGRGFRC